MLPVKFVPKHEVTTFDGDVYYIDSANYAAFCEDWNNCKAIQIGEGAIATASIKSVLPAKSEISLLEKMISEKPVFVKNQVREKVRQREKEKLPLNEIVIANIIEYCEAHP